jgi:hypothetical protein
MPFPSIPLILITFLLISCSPSSRPGLSTDEELKQRLVGKWCVRERDRQNCISHEEISADGNSNACMIDDDLPELVRVTASYTIKNRVICFKVTRSNDAWLHVGHEFCADVLSVDDTEYRLRLHGGVKDEVMYRLQANAPSCPSMRSNSSLQQTVYRNR